jgi:DNA polymerase-3 subunit epsilon
VSLPESLAFIDVETTGANPLVDRVTEIAVIRVEGGRVVERWESLVNPGIPIPPVIQRFTGITDAMVAAAPPFPALAESLQALLEGCVFVAHNARFDYGFIRNELQRAGADFQAPVLCTVKLSRALYPEHHRHGLDALIERHGLHCAARHRAMGDTEVLWSFARVVSGAFPAEALERAVDKAMKRPARPAGLPEGAVEGLPDGPGVYLFYGESASPPLYIGKSVSLRARVMDHFAMEHKSGKEAELARQVCRVEWIETAGELGALLREAALVKSLQPFHNRHLRSAETAFALRLRANRRNPPILERVPIAGTDPAQWEDLVGTFRSRKEVDNLLRELAQLYQLCPRRLGLEPGSGPCLAHQLKRCAGVCAGRERPEEHDARLAGALASSRAKAWPWSGRVVVAEQHPYSGLQQWQLLDRWCHLGSADSPEGLAELIDSRPPRAFELDTYRSLVRWLDAPVHRARVTPWDE